MDFKLIVLILTIILTAVLATVVFIRNPRGEVQKSFLYLISFFIIWALFDMAVYLSHDSFTLTVLTRLTTVASLITAVLFFNFCYRFPSKIPTNHTLALTPVLLTLIALPITALSNGAIKLVIEGPQGKIFTLNALPFFLHSFIITTIFCLAYWILFRKRKIYSGLNRKLIDLIILAAAVPIMAGLILNLFFLGKSANDSYVYGPSFTLFFTVIVTYLIFIQSR